MPNDIIHKPPPTKNKMVALSLNIIYKYTHYNLHQPIVEQQQQNLKIK